MNCPKCSVPVEDGQLTCPACGEQIAANAQKEKVSAAYETTKAIIKKRLRAPVFLTTTIFLTIMLVFFIASMFSTVAGIILGLVPAIFLGIAMVSGYKLYAQKPNLNVKKSLKRFSYFDACTKIFYKMIAIVAIVFGVGGALVSLVLPFYDWWMDPVADTDALFESLDIVTGLIAIAGAAVIVAVFLLFKAVYAARQKAFLNVGDASETGEYVPVKKNVFVLSYVIASFTIFFSVAFAVVPAFADTIMGLLELSPSMAGFVKILLFAAPITSGLAGVLFGIYLILSAKWLQGTQKELIANNLAIAYEISELERVKDAIRDQNFQAEKDAKAAEVAAKQAKADERAAFDNAKKDGFNFI